MKYAPSPKRTVGLVTIISHTQVGRPSFTLTHLWPGCAKMPCTHRKGSYERKGWEALHIRFGSIVKG